MQDWGESNVTSQLFIIQSFVILTPIDVSIYIGGSQSIYKGKLKMWCLFKFWIQNVQQTSMANWSQKVTCFNEVTHSRLKIWTRMLLRLLGHFQLCLSIFVIMVNCSIREYKDQGEYFCIIIWNQIYYMCILIICACSAIYYLIFLK